MITMYWDKSLLLLVVGLGLVSANCKMGERYWCASIQQAAKCGALPFCIQTVWTKEPVNKDTDEVCDICKDMVTQARDTLQSNETQEELKEVFEGSCDLIPIKLVRKECKVLADEFVPELVETLSSEMNPDSVCTVAGLCNSQRIDALLESFYHKNGHCSTCRTQMVRAGNALASIENSELENRLHAFCSQMDSYSDACSYTVSTQLPVIRNMLESIMTKDACTKAVCHLKPIAALSPYSEDIECEFCTKVVKHWIDVYASDSSIEEFKEILDGLCEKIHKHNSAHCKHIVDDYYVPLFEYLRRMDPHMVCSLVGICQDQQLAAQPRASIFPLQAYVPFTPLVKADAVSDGDKPTCLLCEFVMQRLETYLEDKHTAEDVKQYLDQLCQDVPSAYENTCQKFVDKYEPAILALIASEIHPAEICKEIKLCSVAPNPAKKSTGCETCHMVAEEVFSVFSSKDDQDMVRNVLDSICYRFPEYIDTPCEQFVDKYTAAFLEFVGKGLTPDELCEALEMCTAAAEMYDMDYFGQDDSGCIICEYAISYLDKMLTNKTNEDEIKHDLETLCNYLPTNVRKQCDMFVDAYTDMIIQLMTGEITPKEVCGYLGLCQNYANNIMLPPPPMPYWSQQNAIGPVVFYNDKPYCTICEYMITTVDQMLEDKKTEKQIEVALDKVCFVLPDSVQKNCVQLVKEYTDQIIHLLVNDYPPEEVCSELALC